MVGAVPETLGYRDFVLFGFLALQYGQSKLAAALFRCCRLFSILIRVKCISLVVLVSLPCCFYIGVKIFFQEEN